MLLDTFLINLFRYSTIHSILSHVLIRSYFPKQPKQVKVDRAALERYVSLEQRIHEEESKNTLKALTLKEEQLTDLEATLKDKQLKYDLEVKQT